MPAASVTPQSKLRRFLDSGETLPTLIWVFGFCMVVGWLVVGRIKLRRIAREAWPLSGSDWQMLLADARAPNTTVDEVDFESHEGAVLQAGQTTVIWVDDDGPAVLR